MAAPRLRSLPRNVTDVTRVLACVDGTVHNLKLSPDVGSGCGRLGRRTGAAAILTYRTDRPSSGFASRRRGKGANEYLDRDTLPRHQTGQSGSLAAGLAAALTVHPVSRGREP